MTVGGLPGYLFAVLSYGALYSQCLDNWKTVWFGHKIEFLNSPEICDFFLSKTRIFTKCFVYTVVPSSSSIVLKIVFKIRVLLLQTYAQQGFNCFWHGMLSIFSSIAFVVNGVKLLFVLFEFSVSILLLPAKLILLLFHEASATKHKNTCA